MSKLAKIAVVVIAVALVASGTGYYVFVGLRGPPPVASFTTDALDLRLAVDASGSKAPGGNIAAYSWSWGDGATGSGLKAVHAYGSEGDFTVTLTVKDNRGSTSTNTTTVHLKITPTADFIARADRMTISFNASNSFVYANDSTIQSYAWDFGDGTTGTGLRITHTYSNPGRYSVALTVTDAKGRQGTATRFVSPAATTVDVVIDQMFQAGCPYEQYWVLRKDSYGDSLLQNNTPCTDYYPWVYFSADVEHQAVNPSWVYSLYRFDAQVRNHPGYNLSEPVLLPVFNHTVAPNPQGFIQFNVTFNYMTSAMLDQLQNTPFPVNKKYSDGFGYLYQGNITMDLATSRRIFGVQATDAAGARTWWHANTGPSPKRPGPLETKVAKWLEDLGNVDPKSPDSGKYDIYNAFEWYYEADITWLNATVGDDGTTRVQVFWDGWGLDILLARWWYWGNASYRDAVCVKGDFAACRQTLGFGAIQPRGWMPMETCWCEKAKINGRINQDHLDLNLQAVQEYSLTAWANWGRDGIPGTSDDLPAWIWGPYFMDYVPRQNGGSPAAEGYPNSELRWYEGRNSVIGSPGSFGYGQPYEYMLAPTVWRLGAGSTLTMVIPKFRLPWYDPVRSTWNAQAKIGNYVHSDSTATLRYICKDYQDSGTCSSSPGGSSSDFYIWDKKAKAISIAGPYDWGISGMPVQPGPWIELQPEEVG